MSTINGNPITDEENICNIFVGYWDKELNECGGGWKIVRTWTVLDWWTTEFVEQVQVIKLTDEQGPTFTCPADLTVGTDFWYCYANVSVPKPTVFDECGSAYTLSLTSHAGIVVNFGSNYVINQLPLGTHTVTWEVRIGTGSAVGTALQTINVNDTEKPKLACPSNQIINLDPGLCCQIVSCQRSR